MANNDVQPTTFGSVDWSAIVIEQDTKDLNLPMEEDTMKSTRNAAPWEAASNSTTVEAPSNLYERGAPSFPDLLLGAPSPLRWHHQGLQDKIKIVGIDLADRPAWYKEKVYPENKYGIVVDDEDRENEGDLIMGASKVTPEAMAFIVRHGTGIVCVTMKEDDLERLELPLMVTTKENEEKLLTAFTVSVLNFSDFMVANTIEYLKEREELSNLKASYLVGIARSIDKQLFEEAEQKKLALSSVQGGDSREQVTADTA
ncbi:hypothetical protein ABZP36_023040 [Zizania latifolia]